MHFACRNGFLKVLEYALSEVPLSQLTSKTNFVQETTSRSASTAIVTSSTTTGVLGGSTSSCPPRKGEAAQQELPDPATPHEKSKSSDYASVVDEVSIIRENALVFAALNEQVEVTSRLLEPGLLLLWAKADIERAKLIAARNKQSVDERGKKLVETIEKKVSKAAAEVEQLQEADGVGEAVAPNVGVD
ncbi:unnamed protein product [Amoebophrya sp. A120]|nr:unnamed protein product [Amoebophrya sp. A120]|eukprot:GSA120T00014990001.1